MRYPNYYNNDENYEVNLTWDIPTTYEDGNPLPTEEIKEYTIYYGKDMSTLKESDSIVIEDAQTETAVITVPKGTWYFAVSVTTTNNIESQLSNIVTYMF